MSWHFGLFISVVESTADLKSVTYRGLWVPPTACCCGYMIGPSGGLQFASNTCASLQPAIRVILSVEKGSPTHKKNESRSGPGEADSKESTHGLNLRTSNGVLGLLHQEGGGTRGKMSYGERHVDSKM